MTFRTGDPRTHAQEDAAMATVGLVTSRSYVIGLPVVVTVHDDGRVTAEVDLSEASDLWDASTPEDQPTDDATLRADMATVEEAVGLGAVTVLSPPEWCSVCGGAPCDGTAGGCTSVEEWQVVQGVVGGGHRQVYKRDLTETDAVALAERLNTTHDAEGRLEYVAEARP